MKLKSIYIQHNNNNWDNGDIPAHCYGGLAEFDVKGSTLQVKLDNNMVQAIVHLIAPNVLETCEVIAQVSIGQVEAAAAPKILTHEGL